EPLFAETPADGNGNKEVIPFDFFIPDWVICESGEPLDLQVTGWIQIRDVRQASMGILPGHFLFTYSNAAGETFVWQQTGTLRFFFDENGNLIVAVAGRLGIDGVIGRLVFNITTREFEFVAGNEVFSDDLACAALT
ncbi:MAG: hypothetical protein KY466_06540, partial [Gemmatimonadetes bacterium]|nr:hypothetical protein [Gemmatimonadota bacterium]